MLSQYLTHRSLAVTDIFRSGHWQSPWIAGTVAGAIAGYFLWVIAKPRQRTSRAAVVCVLANVLVWLSFLAVTPPLDDAHFSRVERARAQSDMDSDGLDIVEDGPIVVAARWHGTFGGVNFADWLLGVFAGPAIGFAEELIVPSRYVGIFAEYATKPESFEIAGIGFVLSTCFWVAF